MRIVQFAVKFCIGFLGFVKVGFAVFDDVDEDMARKFGEGRGKVRICRESMLDYKVDSFGACDEVVHICGRAHCGLVLF